MSEAPTEDGTIVLEEPPRRASLFARMRRMLETSIIGEPLMPQPEPQSFFAAIQVAWSDGPFLLTIASTTLEFHRDSPLIEGGRDETREWLIHGGAAFHEGLAGFIRVPPGGTVVLGRHDETQTAIFGFLKTVSQRHVEISNRNGNLTLKPLDPDRPCTIAALANDGPAHPVQNQRRRNLERLPSILGHPIPSDRSPQTMPST